MSNLTIKVASLKKLRDWLSEIIDKLDNENKKALRENVITPEQNGQIFADIQALRNILNELDIALINSIIEEITVSSSSPAARIRTSIEKLNKAIEDIKNVRDLLAKITMAISDVQVLIGLL
jgi:hypothetical protein